MAFPIRVASAVTVISPVTSILFKAPKFAYAEALAPALAEATKLEEETKALPVKVASAVTFTGPVMVRLPPLALTSRYAEATA